MRLANDNAVPDRDEEAAAWCLDLSEGVLSAARQIEFDRWYSDAENSEAFQRAASLWDTVEAVASAPEIIQMRSEALEAYRRANLRRWQRLKPSRWIGWKTIASIAAAMVLTIGWSVMPAHDVLRTDIGERRIAMLEDGSRVSLDAASEVDTTFDKRRRDLVLVRGRAKFDVAHNPLRPFTVAIGNKLVVATGTSFSVERLGDDLHIILFEGHVAVLNNQGTAVAKRGGGTVDRELSPGREVVVSATEDSAGVVRASSESGALAWQQGQISFDDEPLPLAAERMNRYLREPLVVGDEAAARVRVNGVFNGGDAAGFLEGVRQLNGVKAEHRVGKVLLTGG